MMRCDLSAKWLRFHNRTKPDMSPIQAREVSFIKILLMVLIDSWASVILAWFCRRYTGLCLHVFLPHYVKIEGWSKQVVDKLAYSHGMQETIQEIDGGAKTGIRKRLIRLIKTITPWQFNWDTRPLGYPAIGCSWCRSCSSRWAFLKRR